MTCLPVRLSISLAGLASILLLAGALAASAAVSSTNDSPRLITAVHLQNVYQAGPSLYSGGSPDDEAGFAEMGRLGVKTIISVDGGRPQLELARKYGMRYIHLPIGYDGIPTHRVVELVKASFTTNGAIYVHCHHGLHRGPAAVAIICQARAGWSTNQAAAWLKQAGTSTNYAGLFRSILEFRPPMSREFVQVGDLPEVAKTSTVVDVMVAIDHEFDHIKAAQKNRWTQIPQRPNLSPVEAAAYLREHMKELERTPDTEKRPVAYQTLLKESSQAAEALRAQLADASSDTTRRDTAMQALGKSCGACHRQFRN